ncbi:hypothetical protein BJ170DRAFT_579519 [Xylariales sp. AK1849]|nr:hypothetical protein BJ170DRAFT_579519 [Xylariales sp. AK1849]
MKRSREPEEEVPAESTTACGDAIDDAVSQPLEIRVSKITELDESAIDDTALSTAMKCSLPGHKEALAFNSYPDFEAHYSKVHSNRCNECKKNFPSQHLLSVHIEDIHDAFAAVLREKGEHTYVCFVEGCDRKCRTPYKRRMHLIDKHMYPKNYFFAVTKDGIDGRSSLLLDGGHHRRKSSASQASGPKAASRRQSLRQQPEAPKAGNEEQTKPPSGESSRQASEEAAPKGESVDTDMADLASAMSALQFVPTSIKFGRGKGKAGFARR